MFSLIVAVGKNNEIGKENKLLWHVPEDLKNFKKITSGKKIVMGRKTFESIGRPLPNRENIILSKTMKNDDNSVLIFDDFSKLIEKFKDLKDLDEEIIIIGGEKVYKKSLELGIVDKMYISYIDFEDEKADAYFPEIDFKNWKKIFEKKYENWKFCIFDKVKKEKS